MFEDQHYSIIHRGVDDVLACQDMLAPAPARPSLLARVWAAFAGAVRGVIRRTEIRSSRPRAARLELTR